MADEANHHEDKEEAANKLWLEQLGIFIGKKKFWSSDKFLSLLAFLISLGTFSTFAYQTYLIQKQQYANTMPYLMIENFRYGGGEYHNYKIGIKNNGVGPAFIRDVKTYYKDSVYRQGPGNFLSTYIKATGLPDTLPYVVNNRDLPPGLAVPAGEYVLLLESRDEASATVMAAWREEVNLEITYSSIYDEVWRVSSDNPVPEKVD